MYFVAGVFVLISLMAFFFDDKKQAPPVAEKPKQVNLAEVNIRRAKDQTVYLRDFVKSQCQFPKSAEVPLSNMAWSIGPDTSIVMMSGTGSAKNAFGMEKDFSYILWLQLREGQKDSIAYFSMKEI